MFQKDVGLSGDKVMKEKRLRFNIVHVCFIEVRDSVLGTFCLEFFRAKLLDK